MYPCFWETACPFVCLFKSREILSGLLWKQCDEGNSHVYIQFQFNQSFFTNWANPHIRIPWFFSMCTIPSLARQVAWSKSSAGGVSGRNSTLSRWGIFGSDYMSLVTIDCDTGFSGWVGQREGRVCWEDERRIRGSAADKRSFPSGGPWETKTG